MCSNAPNTSCPDSFRASTFFPLYSREKPVDGRDKPGHDVAGSRGQGTPSGDRPMPALIRAARQRSTLKPLLAA